MIRTLYLVSDVGHRVFDVYAQIPKILIENIEATYVLPESNFREVFKFLS